MKIDKEEENKNIEPNNINTATTNNDDLISYLFSTTEHNKTNINSKKNTDTASLLSCSSSLIENDDIAYEDSLQDNSFDSDR